MRDKLIFMIQSYIDGEISLGDLEDWYVPKLEIFVDNLETFDIISQLELELADLQDNLPTEDEIKYNLQNIIK